MNENEPAETGQGLTGLHQDGLERQSSWALPEIAPSPCSLIAWGRSDLGQTCVSTELASTPPLSVETLQSKDIVHAAGSIYNSAFVTCELLLDISSWVQFIHNVLKHHPSQSQWPSAIISSLHVISSRLQRVCAVMQGRLGLQQLYDPQLLPSLLLENE